jgi:hypothetical protein
MTNLKISLWTIGVYFWDSKENFTVITAVGILQELENMTKVKFAIAVHLNIACDEYQNPVGDWTLLEIHALEFKLHLW